jgi:hypothetical protein
VAHGLYIPLLRKESNGLLPVRKEQWSAKMSRIQYSDSNGKKKSPFFAVVRNGDTLIANASNPKKIVERLKKNSRSRKKVFKVNSN